MNWELKYDIILNSIKSSYSTSQNQQNQVKHLSPKHISDNHTYHYPFNYKDNKEKQNLTSIPAIFFS